MAGLRGEKARTTRPKAILVGENAKSRHSIKNNNATPFSRLCNVAPAKQHGGVSPVRFNLSTFRILAPPRTRKYAIRVFCLLFAWLRDGVSLVTTAQKDAVAHTTHHRIFAFHVQSLLNSRDKYIPDYDVVFGHPTGNANVQYYFTLYIMLFKLHTSTRKNISPPPGI